MQRLVFVVQIDSRFLCLALYHARLQHIPHFCNSAANDCGCTSDCSGPNGPQERANARADGTADDGAYANVAAVLFAGFENVLGALTRFWKKFSEIKETWGQARREAEPACASSTI